MATSCPRCGKQFKGNSIGSHAVNGCGVTPEEMFWQKIAKAGPDDCWLFTGCKNTTGRAMVTWGRQKNIVASRKVWELTRGPIPEGLYVLHRCDVRHCCNPAHLFLGTYKDNALDAKAKGRTIWGEKNKHAKLTAQQVLEIRRDYKLDSPRRSNVRALAAKYGVAAGTIAHIVQRVTWTHLREDSNGQ